MCNPLPTTTTKKKKKKANNNKTDFEDVPLAEFIDLAFTGMQGDSVFVDVFM